MGLAKQFTKIVCTIGPASRRPEVLEQLMAAGMNVARLNFSHGEFSEHARLISAIRAAAARLGKDVAIMADLPGPKMRVGELADEPVELQSGDDITLTTEEIVGSRARLSVSFAQLPAVVRPGNVLFLNDGIVQLEVRRVAGREVSCRVLVGGELRSRKGLNLPGIELGISAFTDHDQVCLAFALEHGVDAVSQSFVNSAADLEAVRHAAAALGHQPFIIAKIERAGALDNIEEILAACDGIMIARGDLGVEIAIERMAVVQKELMRKAVVQGKPIITATQMLESMTLQKRPTRAEATDVANAILDGTDCVMLSGESAMGRYPVEAVEMLVKIAAVTEPIRSRPRQRDFIHSRVGDTRKNSAKDLIALSVFSTMEHTDAAAVFVPTISGATARNIARFRMPVWVVGVSPYRRTVRCLHFSYGVHAEFDEECPEDWNSYAECWLTRHGLAADLALLAQGPSPCSPEVYNSMQLLELHPA
ncbi:MAG: pyruvate kinase [Desulfobulbaceae bacterium]|nr:MAG: pyruvate kinase [Desulfobulbaceae bacterium]